jgi:hypothetical protein
MKSLNRELVWMVVPVLFLGGVGYLLRNRQPAVLMTPGPFEPYVKAWRSLPPHPANAADGYDTRIEVELAAHGKTPVWWGQNSAGRTGATRGKLVRRQGNKTAVLAIQPFGWSPCRGDDGRWTVEYLLRRRDLNAIQGEIRLRDSVLFQPSTGAWTPTVPLDIPIRKPGERVSMPTVDWAPHLILERYTLDQVPPVMTQGKGQRATLTLYFRKRGALQLAQKYSVSPQISVRDASGNSWTAGASMSSLYIRGKGQERDPYRDGWQVDLHYQSILTPGPEVHPKLPLSLKIRANWNDYWPLQKLIPFKDAQGKIVCTPRLPAPFAVGETRVQRVSGQRNGVDHVVRLPLVPHPGATMPAGGWDTQGSYSQHLVDEHGREYWNLHYSNGAKPIPSMKMPGNGFVEIDYPLAFNDIPASAGKLTFKAEVRTESSARVPINVVVRDGTSGASS